MARLSESALRRLIKSGETTTVELKVAAPRPVEMTVNSQVPRRERLLMEKSS